MVPGIPRDAETIILKCLQKEPSRRYASADELADDLGRFVAGETIIARPVGPLVRSCAGAVVTRHRRRCALLAVAIVTGVGGIFVEWQRAERNLADARSNFGLAPRRR